MNGNRSGREAENAIADLLRRHHIAFRRQVEIGTSIYGTTIRADFVVPPIIGFPVGVVIESKWQDIAGTADEKFPYLLANIRDCYGYPVIVVIDGGGCRPGALQWLKNQVDGQRLVAVLSFTELMSWLLRRVERSESPKLAL